MSLYHQNRSRTNALSAFRRFPAFQSEPFRCSTSKARVISPSCFLRWNRSRISVRVLQTKLLHVTNRLYKEDTSVQLRWTCCNKTNNFQCCQYNAMIRVLPEEPTISLGTKPPPLVDASVPSAPAIASADSAPGAGSSAAGLKRRPGRRPRLAAFPAGSYRRTTIASDSRRRPPISSARLRLTAVWTFHRHGSLLHDPGRAPFGG